MVDLKLYEGQKPVQVTASTLFNVVKAIIAAKKEAEFLQKSQEENVALQASPEVVNFVKAYLYTNKLHENNATMEHIVSPLAGAPNCF
jgi:hypothetical protein